MLEELWGTAQRFSYLLKSISASWVETPGQILKSHVESLVLLSKFLELMECCTTLLGIC